MEVSTVFPHFSALTDGSVLCEISVSTVIIHIVTLLICICGLARTGAVLWLLRIKAITYFIFNQAINDFLFLIFMVPSTLLFLHEEVSCSTIISRMHLSLLFQLSLFSYNMGLYQLTFISFERCRSVLCQVFCHCKLPQRLLWVVMTALSWAFFFVAVVVNPMVTFLCQSQEQEHCQVALLSMYVLNFFLFAAPMLISSIIVFIHFKPGSQQREHKRLDIAIFLTALLSLPLSLLYLLQQLEYTSPVSTEVIFLLTCINSSIKPFIYFLVGSWKEDYSLRSFWRDCSINSCRSHISMQSLREALQRVFEEPEENTAHSNENNAPSDEKNAPSDENTDPSDENTDPSDEITAASYENTSSSDEYTPSSDENTSSSDENTPSSNENTASSDKNTDPRNEITASSYENTASTDVNTASSDVNTDPSYENTDPSYENTDLSDDSFVV
ncbi:mas-related G-protein coupled receptor member H-like [Poecile atricapillus]|uniref:mas-related G-protein coupled receptor member H-like n=1 Tax=Poecile atricapillus TaxID=48891 RepID=UPI00273915A2|nr:mas-related G-protein coupled receptor member H-like [Poecile atricapillus]